MIGGHSFLRLRCLFLATWILGGPLTALAGSSTSGAQQESTPGSTTTDLSSTNAMSSPTSTYPTAPTSDPAGSVSSESSLPPATSLLSTVLSTSTSNTTTTPLPPTSPPSLPPTPLPTAPIQGFWRFGTSNQRVFICGEDSAMHFALVDDSPEHSPAVRSIATLELSAAATRPVFTARTPTTKFLEVASANKQHSSLARAFEAVWRTQPGQWYFQNGFENPLQPLQNRTDAVPPVLSAICNFSQQSASLSDLLQSPGGFLAEQPLPQLLDQPAIPMLASDGSSVCLSHFAQLNRSMELSLSLPTRTNQDEEPTSLTGSWAVAGDVGTYATLLDISTILPAGKLGIYVTLLLPNSSPVTFQLIKAEGSPAQQSSSAACGKPNTNTEAFAHRYCRAYLHKCHSNGTARFPQSNCTATFTAELSQGVSTPECFVSSLVASYDSGKAECNPCYVATTPQATISTTPAAPTPSPTPSAATTYRRFAGVGGGAMFATILAGGIQYYY